MALKTSEMKTVLQGSDNSAFDDCGEEEVTKTGGGDDFVVDVDQKNFTITVTSERKPSQNVGEKKSSCDLEDAKGGGNRMETDLNKSFQKLLNKPSGEYECMNVLSMEFGDKGSFEKGSSEYGSISDSQKEREGNESVVDLSGRGDGKGKVDVNGNGGVISLESEEKGGDAEEVKEEKEEKEGVKANTDKVVFRYKSIREINRILTHGLTNGVDVSVEKINEMLACSRVGC